MRGFKSAILPELNPCMEFQQKLCQKTSVKQYEDDIHKKNILTCSRIHQIQDLGKLK